MWICPLSYQMHKLWGVSGPLKCRHEKNTHFYDWLSLSFWNQNFARILGSMDFSCSRQNQAVSWLFWFYVMFFALWICHKLGFVEVVIFCVLSGNLHFLITLILLALHLLHKEVGAGRLHWLPRTSCLHTEDTGVPRTPLPLKCCFPMSLQKEKIQLWILTHIKSAGFSFHVIWRLLSFFSQKFSWMRNLELSRVYGYLFESWGLLTKKTRNTSKQHLEL